jgi:hypothetical protein
VGSFRKSRLTEAGICRCYVSGISRREICLRSGLYDAEVIEVLTRNGVPLRTPAEAQALAVAARKRTIGTLRLKRSGG